jgi:mono/diheme cytochrome c family protein
MKPIALVAALAALAAPAAAQDVARGEYLVRGPAGCGNCHTPQGPDGPIAGMELAGMKVVEEEAFTAVAPNITPAGRVSDWTDEELARAIREGLRPDGTLIGPPMPFTFYRGLGDEDLAAIVAFLRTVEPVENDPGTSTYNIPLPPAYGPPVDSVTAPERAVSVEYGQYLAGPVAHCLECHTPMGPQGPMLEMLGAGGFEFPGPWGVSVAANITSHEDGLANYTDAEIETMITEGKRPDGTPMMPPMPYGYLARMTEEDLDAVVMYLRTIPPLPDPE